ncbi:MAG: RNA-binding S4 domain-containing protein [Bacteroidetes bacterium]|nr:MAG: RNA-binding S4 domain-containing protein [Bacteroidota bacterium]
MEKTVRIDKWLWSVRLFKTRSQATDACRAGKVKIDDDPVKPSREVKKDQVISLHAGAITKTVKVVDLLEKRVGAKLVPGFMEDLTPAEEYHKMELLRDNPLARRKGRPTKKERREMDDWFGWEE